MFTGKHFDIKYNHFYERCWRYFTWKCFHYNKSFKSFTFQIFQNSKSYMVLMLFWANLKAFKSKACEVTTLFWYFISFFFQKQTCYWKSTSGRIVKLEDTRVSKLYEAEQNILKIVSLEWLQGKCLDCQINIPKGLWIYKKFCFSNQISLFTRTDDLSHSSVYLCFD